MLGWNFSVFRQRDGGAHQAAFDTKEGPRLANWQTGLDGLDWLDALVKEGNAVFLGGNGYPLLYTVQAGVILPRIRIGPPEANPEWTIPEGSILLPGYLGRTTLDEQLIAACSPEEWLIVEVWDES